MTLTSIQYLNELLVIFAYIYNTLVQTTNLDMETCNESISSLFDDSSHSESNTKEECCDGDDELTDVEGGND